MKRLSLVLMVCLLVISSCKKEREYISAIVRDGGDPAADGCGWLIEIPSETFKPDNLAEEFKVDGLEVQIVFDRLESKADCGFSQDVYFEIAITEIQ